MKIQLICAALPPKLDGIGDYTSFLAQELSRYAQVEILAAEGAVVTPIANVSIVPCFRWDCPRSMWEIPRRVHAMSPDWVVLQYNPFMYGRRGLNLHLGRIMREVARHTRVAMMVHERYYSLILNLRTAAMFAVQRWQFGRVASAAHVILFSTDTWMADYVRSHPDKPAFHLPVGSNIPLIGATRQESRRELGVPEEAFIVGLFGTSHVSRLITWVVHATMSLRNRGVDARLLYVGPDSGHVQDAAQGLPSILKGALAAADVSKLFSAMDLYACPFMDGVSTRRASFLAGLEHGIATVGTTGPSTGPLLDSYSGKAFLLARADSEADFIEKVHIAAQDPTLRRVMGENGREVFLKEFAWDKIVLRLMRILQDCAIPAPAL